VKVQAVTGTPGLIFLRAAEGQGAFACLDWYSGFLFSWDVAKNPAEVVIFLVAVVGALVCVYWLATGYITR
jgi:hypothetical protein